MKKLRTKFKEIKEKFMCRSMEGNVLALAFAQRVLVSLIFLILYCIATIVFFMYSKPIGIVLFIISILILFSRKVESIVMAPSWKMLNLIFGKYGNVIGRSDWKRIKRFCPKQYKKYVFSKYGFRRCYETSWIIACLLREAKLMYCSIRTIDGITTAHSVIVRNNCVYDTNKKMHFDYEDFIERQVVEVYKIFDENVYRKQTFFSDIRDDFVQWCKEKHVQCYF